MTPVTPQVFSGRAKTLDVQEKTARGQVERDTGSGRVNAIYRQNLQNRWPNQERCLLGFSKNGWHVKNPFEKSYIFFRKGKVS